ncbi:MAG: leucine-rich repeat domain-containing protein, partial [Clostridia bacterium]|nr:leucine-rich repeat domain-containing protein [Clostridia bacterium]
MVSIHIPSSVTSLGAPEELNKTTITGYTFAGCDNLKSVTFGSDINLSEIYTHTFSGCNSLESIVIPAGVKYIREYAFYHCISLKSVTFMSNDNLQVIENNAFERCITLEEIAIPSSVTAIGDRAFAVCYENDQEAGVRTGLKKVTFGPDSQLTTIGAGAFSSCGLMLECKLPDTVTSIGTNAFYLCQSLKELYIPAGVTTIYANTFYGCSSARTVYIPLSMTTIQAEAFKECQNIDVIYYGGCCESQWNEISIGDQTNSQLLTATRYYAEHILNGAPTCTEGVNCEKCGCQHAAPLGHEWGNWNSNGDDTHSRYCVNDVSHIETETHSYSEEGVCSVCKAELFNFTYVAESDSYAIAGPTASFSGGDVILPSTYAGRPVTSISASAFDPLASQNEEVADACRSITSVTIPDSVVSVHDYAFCHCISLAEINIGENSQLETIGEYAFGGKEEDGTAVTSIFIPSTVTSFDYSSCANTPLTDIYYAGCEHQWLDIPKTGDSSIIAGVTIHVGIHEEVVMSAVEPTCTENGCTEGTRCSICGSIILAQEVVEALGHDYYYLIDNEETHTRLCNNIGCEESLTSKHIFASNGLCVCGDSTLLYTLNDDGETYSIVGSDNRARMNTIDIPETYNGLPVTVIADSAFKGNSGLQTLSIPSSVKTIGSSAFYQQLNLETVTFAEGSNLETIGSKAFYNCGRLSSVIIPSTVETIGSSAFEASKLTDVTFENNVSNIKTIESRVFADTNITSFTIPSSLTTIEAGVFKGADKLQKVVFDDNCLLTSIPESTFGGCSSLTTVTFGTNNQIT